MVQSLERLNQTEKEKKGKEEEKEGEKEGGEERNVGGRKGGRTKKGGKLIERDERKELVNFLT